MSRFSKIFADEQEETVELKPLYEHLDGTVEVLGFESFGYSIETAQPFSAEENRGLRDSIEADIVLLETIASQQDLTQRQDTGTSTPNYDGLNIIRQKTELSEDAKKLYKEEGIDYRKISAEGFVDKVKEIWHWIVEKIKKWWNALFGESSTSTSVKTTENNKNSVKALSKSGVKERVEKISTSIVEGDEKAAGQFKQSLQKFNFNKWVGILLKEINKPLDRGVDLFDIETPLKLHLERTEKFCRLLEGVGKSVENSLIPVAENYFKTIWTQFKDYFKPLSEVEGTVSEAKVADWTRSLILVSNDDYTQSVRIEVDEELRLTLKENLEVDYDEMVRLFKEKGKEQMVRHFESFVRTAENLVASTQKTQDNFTGYGKRIAELKDKMNKEMTNPDEVQLKIQKQFVRYALDVITIAQYANSELGFIESFTAALINFCTGFVGIEMDKGGAIVDPHVDWKKKG